MHSPEVLDPGGARPSAVSAAPVTAGGPPGTGPLLGGPPGTGPRGRWRTILARPAARQLVLLACYLAAGIAVTWPRTAYLTGRLPAIDDVASYEWDLWWVAHQVAHLGNPWFTGHLAAPVGIQLGFDTTMPLIGLIMTPVTLAFGPAAALALLTALTPGLACYALYRAARLWLRSQTGAIAAGAFFGLSTMLTFQNWYHVNIAIGAVSLPLALEAAVRLRRHAGPGQGVVLGVVLGAAVLVNLETAVMAALVAALALVPWLLRRPAPARLAAVAASALTGLLIASPQLIAMAYQASTEGVAGRDVYGYFAYSARLPGLFGPSPRVADFGMPELAAIFHVSKPGEGIPAFGLLLSVLAVAGVAAAWRRRSGWLLALLWLGAAWLALGPVLQIGDRRYIPLSQMWSGVPVSRLMPYTWMVRLTGLSGFREPDRLALLGLMAAALLAGSAVDWLRYHARPLIIVVAALAALEAGWSGSPGVKTMATALPRVDRPIAADHSGSIVVDVPFGLRGGLGLYGGAIAPQALLLATADGHPRAIAYTSWVPVPTTAAIKAHPFYDQLVAAQRGRRASAAQAAAARLDARRMAIGWVLVWESHTRLHTRQVMAFLNATGFRFDYRAAGVMVYRPGGQPRGSGSSRR